MSPGTIKSHTAHPQQSETLLNTDEPYGECRFDACKAPLITKHEGLNGMCSECFMCLVEYGIVPEAA